MQEALTRVESETQTLREQGHYTLANGEAPSQFHVRSAEYAAQLEKGLQAQMAKLRGQTHIELVELNSKVERLSESIHCMGETSQAHAESVHTELLRLQEAAQARPLPWLRCSV